MRINMARIGSRISRKVPRIRFLRSWRGYSVGAVIAPPGAQRQILLQAKDPLGNKIAELVEETAVMQVVLEPPVEKSVETTEDSPDATPKARRGKKN